MKMEIFVINLNFSLMTVNNIVLEKLPVGVLVVVREVDYHLIFPSNLVGILIN